MEEIAKIGSAAREWRFQLAGSDKVWSLPLMGSLPVKTSRDVAKLAEVKTNAEMLDAAISMFDALCPGLSDVVTTDQLADVMVSWQEASGIAPGKSQASSD